MRVYRFELPHVCALVEEQGNGGRESGGEGGERGGGGCGRRGEAKITIAAYD